MTQGERARGVVGPKHGGNPLETGLRGGLRGWGDDYPGFSPVAVVR